MQRFLILSPPSSRRTLSLSLSSPFPSFSCLFSSALHQDAIIQDISEEELKALTVEEGPRVLSERALMQTHTHAREHERTL